MEETRLLGLSFGEAYEIIREHVAESFDEFAGVTGDGYVSEPFVDRGDLRRFLSRLGVLERGSPPELMHEMLDSVATATATPRPVVEKVCGLFCSGDGVPEQAVCGKNPQCGRCPLQARCRFAMRKPTIKQLPADERPRERLIRDGEAGLSNAELLGIVIGGGTMEETAVDLGRRLLSECGTLRELSTKTMRELCAVRGIGPARGAQLKAAFALAARLMSEGSIGLGKQYCSSKAIFDAFYPRLRDVRKEVFLLVLLDSKNRVIRTMQVSEGSLSSSLVHPREVYSAAIRESASAVVFVHNHPSGDPTPSMEDRRLTTRLKEVGETVGIRVLDHIVVGEGCYYSFLDQGAL